ncbi:hypothetical protein PGDDIFCJ_00108 [Thermus phage YS40_Isch]|nr:hypothetical protein PGDDIFCJ_00108 [Thermus phage YS40_Isch]
MQSLIKNLNDFEDIKSFLPFLEIIEARYFYSEKGVANEIKMIEKEDYLRMISRLAVDKKDKEYIFFHQVFDPKIKYYFVAHEYKESKVFSNVAKHLPSYTFARFNLSEIEYFKKEIEFLSKIYPNVYLLVLDYRIATYKENVLTKRVELIAEHTFGRIYRVKYCQEVF